MRKVYNDQVLACWKDNKAKCYYLILSHTARGRWNTSSRILLSERRRRATKMWLLSSR